MGWLRGQRAGLGRDACCPGSVCHFEQPCDLGQGPLDTPSLSQRAGPDNL